MDGHYGLGFGRGLFRSYQAERTGLVWGEAKMSRELHPPLSYDKGSAVEELVAGLDAACFMGDDVGDLPAFAALDRLAERGVATLKVAVTTSESVKAMVERADLLVDGPQGALAPLHRPEERRVGKKGVRTCRY